MCLNNIVHSQLAHDVAATLGFVCIFVATSDKVITTLSQRCVSDVVTMMFDEILNKTYELHSSPRLSIFFLPSVKTIPLPLLFDCKKCIWMI